MREDLVKEGKNIKEWLENYDDTIASVETLAENEGNKIVQVKLENGWEPLFLTYKDDKLQKHVYIYEYHGMSNLRERNLVLIYGHEETKLIWTDTLEVDSIYTH